MKRLVLSLVALVAITCVTEEIGPLERPPQR